jgi:hypothetical protein
MDVLLAHVFPHAMSTKAHIRNVMLVCRAVARRARSSKAFWEPLLQETLKRKFDAFNLVNRSFMGLLRPHYVMWPPQLSSVLDVVRSKFNNRSIVSHGTSEYLESCCNGYWVIFDVCYTINMTRVRVPDYKCGAQVDTYMFHKHKEIIRVEIDLIRNRQLFTITSSRFFPDGVFEFEQHCIGSIFQTKLYRGANIIRVGFNQSDEIVLHCQDNTKFRLTF